MTGRRLPTQSPAFEQDPAVLSQRILAAFLVASPRCDPLKCRGALAVSTKTIFGLPPVTLPPPVG